MSLHPGRDQATSCSSQPRQDGLLAENFLRLRHRQWAFLSCAGEWRLCISGAHKWRVCGVIRSGRADGAAERRELDEMRDRVLRWPAASECGVYAGLFGLVHHAGFIADRSDLVAGGTIERLDLDFMWVG